MRKLGLHLAVSPKTDEGIGTISHDGPPARGDSFAPPDLVV